MYIMFKKKEWHQQNLILHQQKIHRTVKDDKPLLFMSFQRVKGQGCISQEQHKT